MVENIKFLNKEISMYSIMAMLGILVCSIYAILVCKKYKINKNDDVLKMMLWSGLGLFIGGHLLYAVTKFDSFIILITHLNKIKSFQQLIDCFVEVFGGQVFYGGLIGGLLTASIYAKKHKMDKDKIFDLLVPIIPLFHFFGRIGCFLSGCCFGIESKFGFIYHHNLIEEANGVRRFPVQLFEAGFNIILFILLYFLSKNKKLKGRLPYLYLMLYPVGRFILEFFRGDEYRGFLFGLSTSQIISIILFIFATSMMIIKTKKLNDSN